MICRYGFRAFPISHLDNKMNKWSIPENLVNKKFLSPKELKDVLGISLPTVYRLIESRKLPFFKIGKSLRFLREDIIDYLENHRIDHIM